MTEEEKIFLKVDAFHDVFGRKYSNLFCFFSSRDGRFRLGDEIINVNGKSLRGLTMDEAKGLLRTCGPEVDIILARDPDQAEASAVPTSSTAGAAAAPVSSAAAANTSSSAGVPNGPMGPVERRRRRKLPPIERPRSAPIHNLLEPESGLRTVIKIGSNSQSIEHHHHHVHHLGKKAQNALHFSGEIYKSDH